jgi:hypothetical protein
MDLLWKINCHLDNFHGRMITHYEYTRRNTFFIQLINIKQNGSVAEHIEKFQRLNIKVTNIPYEHLIDVFIGTLKDNIQHRFHLWEPKSLENAFRVVRKVEIKNMTMTTRNTTLTSIEKTMFLLLNHLNLQVRHLNNWRK